MLAAGVWIHNTWEFAGVCIVTFTVVIVSALREIREVIEELRADFQAWRARKQLHLVRSKHR